MHFLRIVGRNYEHLRRLDAEAVANRLDQDAAIHAWHHPVDKRHREGFSPVDAIAQQGKRLFTICGLSHLHAAVFQHVCQD